MSSYAGGPPRVLVTVKLEPELDLGELGWKRRGVRTLAGEWRKFGCQDPAGL